MSPSGHTDHDARPQNNLPDTFSVLDMKPLFAALEKAQAAAEARKRKQGKPLRTAGA